MMPIPLQFLLVLTAGAPVPAVPEQPVDWSVVDRFGEMKESAHPVDWSKEVGYIDQALERVWQKNEWNDDAGRFAFDLAREVLAIPPWQVMDRLNIFTDRVSKRYEFSTEQMARLQGLTLREGIGLAARHAPMIIRQTNELMATRTDARPITTEQVARWVTEIDPFLDDARKVLDRMTTEIRPTFSEKQKEILDRDLKSISTRMDYINKVKERWAKGDWEPREWGLQDDPIQNGTERARRDAESAKMAAALARAEKVRALASRGPEEDINTSTPKAAIAKHWVPHEPQTWLAYVVDFQKRFGLDPGQCVTAKSIHKELVDRATVYMTRDERRLAKVPPGQRSTDEAYEPVRSLFTELKVRLEPLPTTAQREQSKP